MDDLAKWRLTQQKMKKRLTVHEFSAYMKLHDITSISYWSENQEWYDISDPCKVRMTFSVMLIFENPNVISLRCGKGIDMSFDRIKYIEIDEESTILGTIVMVYCGYKSHDKEYNVYTFVVS